MAKHVRLRIDFWDVNSHPSTYLVSVIIKQSLGGLVYGINLYISMYIEEGRYGARFFGTASEFNDNHHCTGSLLSLKMS